MKVTGKVTTKNYECCDCGHKHSVSTNHYGEIYSRCPKCSWKVGQGLKHKCTDPLPKGWTVPEPWKRITLGEIATFTPKPNNQK